MLKGSSSCPVHHNGIADVLDPIRNIHEISVQTILSGRVPSSSAHCSKGTCVSAGIHRLSDSHTLDSGRTYSKSRRIDAQL